ncbi:hypothetical protein NE237_021079 [Protea cynaroides]|uniref:Uncharacterized protein n=1 Tax=Protea cynaroides TaxID=273540 RepID=A0A9Q0H8G5_9MAGN|nr:hypothetical protein NE237_021079 [Protea cynaroides]
MKSQQATYLNENIEKDTDEISPSVLGEAVVNEDDSQLKGHVDVNLEGSDSHSRLEEVCQEEEIQWVSWRATPDPLFDPPTTSSASESELGPACPDSAFCVPNRFGCLVSDDAQTTLLGPSGPPASPAIVQPSLDPSDPLPDPTKPLSSPGLTSPLCSAGHTPYPPRRPFLHKPRGSIRQASPSCMYAIKTPTGSTEPNLESSNPH